MNIWLLPIESEFIFLALDFNTFNIWSISLTNILPDWTNWILKLVSNTSEEVIPWCKYPLIPTFSVTEVEKQ